MKPVHDALVARCPELSKKFFGWRIVPKLNRQNWEFIKRFSKEGAQFVATNHTSAAIYQPTVHPGVVAALGRLFESSETTSKTFRPKELEPIRYRPTYVRVRYCPRCFHEQVAKYGVAYYRRQWEVPYITNCTVHREPLLGIGCPYCGGNDGVADLSRNFEQHCRRCSADLWQPRGLRPTDTSLRTDAWFDELIHHPLPYLSIEQRTQCFQMAADRLDGGRLDVDTSHRCTNECDDFACPERLQWMLDRSGVVKGQSLVHHLQWNKRYMGIPVFLLFWIPIIHAFRTVANFRPLLDEGTLATTSLAAPYNTPPQSAQEGAI